MKDYFFEVVSRCNFIKVMGTIQGQADLSWKIDLKGQPTYDSDQARGKIVCGDQQTVNFWRKYIPIAALDVGNVSCKAWTWEEYEIPKIRYSCLIPFDTCKGVEVRDLIHATLAVNKLSIKDVLTCRTSYAKLLKLKICNIEVTDLLATAINDAGRLLCGPVCSLSFKLQTANTESESAAGSQLDGDTCSQLLDSSNDTLIQPQSPTSSISSHIKSMVVSHPGDPPT